MTQNDTEADIRIIGPTVAGEFFFADTQNNIWDGKHWRGFGIPEMFREFQHAFAKRSEARTAYAIFAKRIAEAAQ